MDVQAIAEQARASLGPFCMSVCRAACCKRGKLVVKEHNVDNVTKGRTKELIASGRLTEDSGVIRLDLAPTCPSLNEDSSCGVYETRPQGCREYPLYVYGSYFVADEKCLGVEKGKIDAFLKQLEEKGLKRI